MGISNTRLRHGQSNQQGPGAPVARATTSAGAELLIPVSPGELIDRISILEIKRARIAQQAKLANVLRELEHLLAVQAQALRGADDFEALAADLKQVNEQLWEIEDAIRLCEK